MNMVSMVNTINVPWYHHSTKECYIFLNTKTVLKVLSNKPLHKNNVHVVHKHAI